MNKRDFIKMVSAKSGIPQAQVKECFDPIVTCLTDLLVDGEELCISNFGTLHTKRLPERVSRNPSTKESIKIPVRHIVKFKTSNALKIKINKK